MYDHAIVGAGIAGASVAALLEGETVLLEAEDTPGYHSTGRSATFWHETLGGRLVQQLTTASGPYLRAGGYLSPRRTLNVAEEGSEALLEAMAARFAGTPVRLTRIGRDALLDYLPHAAPTLIGALIEEDSADIDAAALHAARLTAFRKRGGAIETGFRVDAIMRDGDFWRIASGGRVIAARMLVNAAGAWADSVAALAGATPLGVQPYRRTIVQARVDRELPRDLPFTIDVAGTFYFKAEGGNRVWASPHDETPVDAHDVAPEELDVAIAIDRLETITGWRVLVVERKWAGLRSFAPDRVPVYGFDTRVPRFFWCAGQGGTGIQTSPAAAKLCAELLLGKAPETDPTPYAPDRFGI
ncbi:MAG: FAD-binding oxidoreductase [Sphingomonadaceae bacterium]|nr:FAD-binding oxidoreductase [Sphingomonadaceae bacterium]